MSSETDSLGGAGATAFARPTPPTFIPERKRPIGADLRTLVRQGVLRIMDAGLPFVPPLQAHVVICGFPRSGSTLLLLIAEACYQDIRAYRHEKSALVAARELTRTHPIMITKRPADVFRVDEISDFYAKLKPRPRFVLTKRDPRAVLTSRYSGKAVRAVTRGPDGYVMSVEVWRQWFAHFEYARKRDETLVIEYADLITKPLYVQERFASFIGSEPDLPFDQFLTAVPKDFVTQALNGVRPFDVTGLDRWKKPQYRGRINELLTEMPDLPDLLIHMGYESDRSWTKDYV